MDRAAVVHQNFLTRVKSGDFPNGEAAKTDLPAAKLIELCRAQVLSRHLPKAVGAA